MRDRLEELLAAKSAAAVRAGSDHLASCPDCATELEAMRNQAEMMRSLRAPEELDPAPGFYARVMQRIEERAKYSIWSAFLYSPFAKRLVYASVTLAVMLGTYVLTEESRDGHLRGNTIVAQSFSSEDAPVTGSQAQQRAAVLANFVSYSPSSIDEGPLQ